MSEEEIIKYLKTIKPKNFNNYKDETHCSLITKKQIKAIQGLLDLYNKEKEKNEELEKYDYRKIKIEEKDRISSIYFTKEQLDLMNLGIALYVGISKILADTEDEETDI